MLEKLTDQLDPQQFQSLPELIDYCLSTHAELPGFSCFGKTMKFAEVDELSQRFANFLQNQTDLQPGDRIAIQLPNVLQFPIALYGALSIISSGILLDISSSKILLKISLA